MPFVPQARKSYLLNIQQTDGKEPAMNWILEAYSNVYNVATLQERGSAVYVAPAKKAPSRIARLLGRKVA
jgi:hypothetical protein